MFTYVCTHVHAGMCVEVRGQHECLRQLLSALFFQTGTWSRGGHGALSFG